MFESCFKPWDWNFPHFAQPNFFVPLRKVRSCCSSVRFPLAEGPNIQLTQLHRSSRKIWVLPREYHQIWMIFGARLKQKTFVLPSCKGGPLNTRDKSRGTRDMMACFYGIGRQSMASIFFALEPPTGDKSCSRCVRRNCDVFFVQTPLFTRNAYPMVWACLQSFENLLACYLQQVILNSESAMAHKYHKSHWNIFLRQKRPAKCPQIPCKRPEFLRKARKTRKVAFFLLDDLLEAWKFLRKPCCSAISMRGRRGEYWVGDTMGAPRHDCL